MSLPFRRACLAVAVLVTAAHGYATAQSSASRPVPPAAKSEHRADFLVPADALPATRLALPPVDSSEIAAAKFANTHALHKALQIGIGRPTFGYREAEGGALDWRTVDGGLAARWDVISPGAAALRVELVARAMPKSLELRFSGEADPATVYGPFTLADFDSESASLWSPVLMGERATIEVFVPRGAVFAANGLAIAHVSHLFVSPIAGEVRSLAKTGESGTCEVDLICQSASSSALANIGKAVARMTFTDGASTYLCTGTLLNPTDGSNTPYFYSATHCIDTQAVANTLTTHWFFDRTGCASGGTSASYVQRTGGATLLHTNANSDVLLLQLKTAPPAGAWFAGWDATAMSNGSALTAVHHPKGDWKKVSQGSKTGVQNGLGAGFPSGSFTIVNWSQGVTEGGSSGSGIFTAVGSTASDYRFRGGLWGGSSSCSTPLAEDYYSRLDQAYSSIRQWIDPPLTGMVLTISKAGAGSGTVTSAPAGVSCGGICMAGFSPGTVVTLTAASASGSSFTGWGGACSGVAPCEVTMDVARSVTAAFAPTASPRLLDVSVASIDFGNQSMGTTSPAVTVRLVNVGANVVTFGTIATSDAQFGQSGNCTTLAPGAACTLGATFMPAVLAGPLNSSADIAGALVIPSNAAGSPVQIPLGGSAEKSLVSHFYRSILRRAPDAPGKAFWQAEAPRMAGLGANVNEAWYALAAAFFGSAEYAAFNRGDADFVTDLYNTFFNRAPDPVGLAFWNQELYNGLPRGVALAGFMFSPEFTAFTQAIFGNTAARPEVDTVMDFYRGLLARLPDSPGFDYWLQRFRAAQCQGSAAVLAEAEAISGAFANGSEYAARARTNAQFVGDVYNAFLRRGGDIGGVQYWLNQLLVGAKTRERVRQDFLVTSEFSARVNAITAAGCAP